MPVKSVSDRRRLARIAGLALPAILISSASAAFAGADPGRISLRPATSAIPIAVFGDDRRAIVDTGHRTLAKFIGTLRAGQASICTAFCLGDDIIATASHCLFGTSAGKGPDLGAMTFATDAAADDAAPIAGRETGMLRQNIVSGTQHLNVAPPIDASNDWAIARLASPVCRAGGLPIADEAASAQPLFQIAMHRDLPDTALRYDGPCPRFEDVPEARADLNVHDFTDAAALIFHRCDTGPGSSGSPMLVDSGDGPKVAGINIGTYVISHTVVGARAGETPNESLPIANTAVKARVFAEAMTELRSRDLLATRDDIMRLEMGLKRLGHYRAAARGQMTPALQSAIERFEASLRQPPTGLARRALLDALDPHAPKATYVRPGFATPMLSLRK